jgi:hypothetical protein
MISLDSTTRTEVSTTRIVTTARDATTKRIDTTTRDAKRITIAGVTVPSQY